LQQLRVGTTEVERILIGLLCYEVLK